MSASRLKSRSYTRDERRDTSTASHQPEMRVHGVAGRYDEGYTSRSGSSSTLGSISISPGLVTWAGPPGGR